MELIWSCCIFFLFIISSSQMCPPISNPDCHCTNPASSNTQPDIACAFLSHPPAPLFTNQSNISIKTLDLSDNSLQTLPPDFLQGVHAVQTLDLRNNLFRQVPAVVSKLGKLVFLDLSRNKVDTLPLNILATIPGLETLELSRNMLKSLSDDDGTTKDVQFRHLKMLNLSHNSIESINGSIFNPMRHLITLDLSHNRLREVTDAMFFQLMYSLNTLDLSHNLLHSINTQALQHLQHVRVLSLAHNSLTDVNSILFPPHLQSLDLSHCALTIINHCQFTSLADLSYIRLLGNDLRCTCQLYLLLQWYQDQHHRPGNLQAENVDSNWTCVNTNVTIKTLSPSRNTPPPSLTDPPDSNVQYVLDLQECEDTESHCLTMEHAQHHLKGSSQMKVTLDVASSGNTLIASWTFNENGEEAVDGFRLRYMPEDADPINSPIIPINERNYIMRLSQLENHFMLCLDVLAYQTAVIYQKCRNFKDDSSNVVIGILAGAVFLVPCIGVMIYIIIKDRSIQKNLRILHNQTEAEKLAHFNLESPEKPLEVFLRTGKGVNHAEEGEEPLKTNYISRIDRNSYTSTSDAPTTIIINSPESMGDSVTPPAITIDSPEDMADGVTPTAITINTPECMEDSNSSTNATPDNTTVLSTGCYRDDDQTQQTYTSMQKSAMTNDSTIISDAQGATEDDKQAALDSVSERNVNVKTQVPLANSLPKSSENLTRNPIAENQELFHTKFSNKHTGGYESTDF